MISKFGRFFCIKYFCQTHLFKVVLELRTKLEFLKATRYLYQLLFLIKNLALLKIKKFELVHILKIESLFKKFLYNVIHCISKRLLETKFIFINFCFLNNYKLLLKMGSSGAGVTYNQMVRNASIHPSIATESARKPAITLENASGEFFK